MVSSASDYRVVPWHECFGGCINCICTPLLSGTVAACCSEGGKAAGVEAKPSSMEVARWLCFMGMIHGSWELLQLLLNFLHLLVGPHELMNMGI